MKKATLTMVNTLYGELVLYGDDFDVLPSDYTIVRAESDVPQFFTLEEAQVVCGSQYELTVEWRAVERFIEIPVRDEWRLILVLDSDVLQELKGCHDVLTILLKRQVNKELVPNKVSRFVDEIPDDAITKVVVKDGDDIPY